MQNNQAIPFNKENFKQIFSKEFVLVILLSVPSAIIAIFFNLDPEFVSFHHIIRLLMILFIVPLMLKIIAKKA
jgi:uncharacterized membrane protein AbrB (regulator of aidB expression)